MTTKSDSKKSATVPNVLDLAEPKRDKWELTQFRDLPGITDDLLLTATYIFVERKTIEETAILRGKHRNTIRNQYYKLLTLGRERLGDIVLGYFLEDLDILTEMQEAYREGAISGTDDKKAAMMLQIIDRKDKLLDYAATLAPSTKTEEVREIAIKDQREDVNGMTVTTTRRIRQTGPSSEPIAAAALLEDGASEDGF